MSKPKDTAPKPNRKLRVKTQQEKQLELRVESQKAELIELREEKERLQKRADQKHDAWVGESKRADAVTEENHKLRGLIHSGELAYAKLFGYVERIRDERPPEMVPQQRESLLSTMPDGTQGFEGAPRSFGYPDQHFAANRERQKRWFER